MLFENIYKKIFNKNNLLLILQYVINKNIE
jgi:hypothetical protein